MNDLKDKAVLITGASTGIGAGAARAFGAAGARVAVHYNNSKAEAEKVAADVQAAGGKAITVGGDVTSHDTVRRIVADTLAAFGRIDVLVNNAGGLIKRTPIAEYSDALVDKVLTLNVKQVIWFVMEVVAIMRRQGGGNIINVSSIAARHGGGPGSIIYAGSKGFVATATRGWAKG